MWTAWENSMNQAREDGINQGISQGKITSVLRVAERFNIGVEEAMKVLDVSKSEWDEYSSKF